VRRKQIVFLSVSGDQGGMSDVEKYRLPPGTTLHRRIGGKKNDDRGEE